MKKEFKASKSVFQTYIGIALFFIIVGIGIYWWLNIVFVIVFLFSIFFIATAFWTKNRALVTLHDEYIEAKESLISKKKLIKYRDIQSVEKLKNSYFITLKMKDSTKKNIGIGNILKPEVEILLDSLKEKLG